MKLNIYQQVNFVILTQIMIDYQLYFVKRKICNYLGKGLILIFFNLMELSYQIEISRTETKDFWKEYDNFWIMFAYDECYSPFEYARVFLDCYINKNISSYNKIILLRLSKNNLMKSYNGIDGVYY